MTARFREVTAAVHAVVAGDQRTGNPHALEYRPGLLLPFEVTELTGSGLNLEAVSE